MTLSTSDSTVSFECLGKRLSLTVNARHGLGFSRTVPDTWSALSGVHADRIAAACSAGTVLDIGAFVGDTALWFAVVGHARRVVTVEPDAFNFKYLEHNITANGLSETAIPVNSAVGARCGVARAVYCPRNSSMLSFRDTLVAGKDCIPVTTVDSLVAAMQIKDLSVIKIDVEGGEADVLVGARDTMCSQRPVIVTEIWRPGVDVKFGSDTADVFVRIVREMADSGYVMLGNTSVTDYIFVPREYSDEM